MGDPNSPGNTFCIRNHLNTATIYTMRLLVFVTVFLCIFWPDICNAVLSSSAPAIETSLLLSVQQKHDRKSKHTLFEDIKTTACRIPKAVIRSAGDSAKTFVTSSSILVPISLAMNIKNVRPVDAWLWSGIQRGTHWAQTSAVFVGTETFITTLRDKHDNLNAQLASGVSSAVVRINEGPMGMAKGFCIGFGLMCALDRAFPRTYASDGRKLSRWGPASSLLPSTRTASSSVGAGDTGGSTPAGSRVMKSTPGMEPTGVPGTSNIKQPFSPFSPRRLLGALNLRK